MCFPFLFQFYLAGHFFFADQYSSMKVFLFIIAIRITRDFPQKKKHKIFENDCFRKSTYFFFCGKLWLTKRRRVHPISQWVINAPGARASTRLYNCMLGEVGPSVYFVTFTDVTGHTRQDSGPHVVVSSRDVRGDGGVDPKRPSWPPHLQAPLGVTFC